MVLQRCQCYHTFTTTSPIESSTTPVEINEIPVKVPFVHLFLSNLHVAQGVAEPACIAHHNLRIQVSFHPNVLL